MFDRVVEREPFSLRRGLLGVTSLVLHALALVVLALFSLLHVPEIAPPAVTVTFLSAPPPPPPPPPAGASKPKPRVERKPEQPKEAKPLVQPEEIPELEPTEPVTESPQEEGPPGEEGGVEGGVAGGVAGGVVGGVVGSTGAPASPKMVASFVLAAQQLEHPPPRLPEWFKQQHPQQTVKGIYKVCIGTDGRVSEVTPMTPIPGVDELVVAQIKQGWSYKPQPLPICTASVIVFQIN